MIKKGSNVEENPEWRGNYKVRYWDNDWQNIIYGKDNSYLGNHSSLKVRNGKNIEHKICQEVDIAGLS